MQREILLGFDPFHFEMKYYFGRNFVKKMAFSTNVDPYLNEFWQSATKPRIFHQINRKKLIPSKKKKKKKKEYKTWFARLLKILYSIWAASWIFNDQTYKIFFFERCATSNQNQFDTGKGADYLTELYFICV